MSDSTDSEIDASTDSGTDAAPESDPEIPDDAEVPEDVPDWDDEYLDRVSDRLMFNFDLEKDETVRGERFDMYGELRMQSEKHFFHPSLSFAHHEAREHLFARRVDSPSVSEFERLIDLGHDLADEWIEPNEEHYGTEFTFVLVAPETPDEVGSFVEEFRDRTLLKFGYYGHYETNLVAVAPDAETLVASENADVRTAFATWESIEREEPGLLDLIARRLQL
jgi:hypothetical protein